MDEILHRFNPWWTGSYDFPGIPRTAYLSGLEALRSTKDVVLITGLRRVGKTTLMYQLIHRLLNTTDPHRIFYVSLDNLALTGHTILDIVDSFRRINSLKFREPVYLFLDEVHLRENYELQLKNLYDMGHCKIYASGSASLDIIMRSPHLTGRQRMVHVNPLDFSEYLMFTGRTITPADSHLYPALARDYIETGGLPEYVQSRDPNVLQSLVDSILYRDIATHNVIRNRENLRDVLLSIARSVSTPVSANRIARVLGINADTVRSIIRMIVEAGLVHPVEKEGKFSARKASLRKYYLADTGLFTILADTVNLGARVENAVFLKLAKSGTWSDTRSGTVRYSREKEKEVDFVVGSSAYESRYRNEIAPEDIATLKNLRGFRKRVVVTNGKEGDIEGTQLVPLWKFLLDDETQNEL